MCECELRMKILLIFTLCLISDGGAAEEVTGYSGGGVLIKCKYKAENAQNNKYFCKDSWTGCSDQIKTGDKNSWIDSGRFSLYDDTKSLVFWVMIRELTVQDTGTYQCAVDRPRRDIYKQMELDVKEDLSYKKSISETVHVGGDFNFSCKYPESLRSNPKFLCKSLQPANCSYIASRTHESSRQFSLYGDRRGQILNMALNNVTEQDAGEYWCGAEAAWESDHGYKVYVTQINLTVTGPSTPTHGSVVSSLSSPPPPPPPPPGLSPVSIVVTVLVNILIGLLIGSGCLFVILRIKQKIKARTESHDRRSVPDSGNNHEDFKDTRSLVVSEAGIATVSSTAQLPTIPSDPSQTIYSNIELPASSRDSASSISTAQLPTGLPDSSTESVEKPADGPTYATVRFHSSSTNSNDAALKIRFQKEADSCEYAAVSHGHP